MLDINKLDEVDKLRLDSIELAIENYNLKLLIANHNKDDLIKQFEEKYKEVKEKENGNDR